MHLLPRLASLEGSLESTPEHGGVVACQPCVIHGGGAFVRLLFRFADAIVTQLHALNSCRGQGVGVTCVP